MMPHPISQNHCGCPLSPTPHPAHPRKGPQDIGYPCLRHKLYPMVRTRERCRAGGGKESRIILVQSINNNLQKKVIPANYIIDGDRALRK